MLARIFTEDVNRAGILSTVGRYFDGFTVIESLGFWRGKREKSLVIEVVCEGKDQAKVEAICREINLANKQECCMVQYLETAVRFV